MLQNILSHSMDYVPAQVADIVAESAATILEKMNGDDENSLNAGDVAHWSAGFLYGASGRTIDQRDYILGCSSNCPIVNRKFTKAYKAYNDDNIERGNDKLQSARLPWRLTMLTCWDTNSEFTSIMQSIDDFLVQADYMDQAQANFDANPDVISLNWSNGLKTWNEGVYFNAGMFYGEVLVPLTATDETF